MPIWLEVFLAWIVIGAVLNLSAYTVFYKRGYFKWLNDVHDSIAYRTGYENAKKEMGKAAPVYDPFSRSTLAPQLREHGIEDNRYK